MEVVEVGEEIVADILVLPDGGVQITVKQPDGSEYSAIIDKHSFASCARGFLHWYDNNTRKEFS